MRVAILAGFATLRSYEQRTFILDNHDSVAALRLLGFLALWRWHVPADWVQYYAFCSARLAGLAVVRSARQVTGSRL